MNVWGWHLEFLGIWFKSYVQELLVSFFAFSGITTHVDSIHYQKFSSAPFPICNTLIFLLGKTGRSLQGFQSCITYMNRVPTLVNWIDSLSTFTYSDFCFVHPPLRLTNPSPCQLIHVVTKPFDGVHIYNRLSMACAFVTNASVYIYIFILFLFLFFNFFSSVSYATISVCYYRDTCYFTVAVGYYNHIPIVFRSHVGSTRPYPILSLPLRDPLLDKSLDLKLNHPFLRSFMNLRCNSKLTDY